VIRKVSTLLVGNVLAQAVHVVTMLAVVGGYFAPAEFGAYAVGMSFVGILSSVACFRYELGIVSTRSDAAAANIAAASAAIAVVVSVGGYWLVGPLIDLLGRRITLGATALMIASLVFFKALDQIAGSLLFRREAYLQYSALRVVQAVLLLAGFYMAARASATTGGMLLATLVSYVAFALGGFAFAARHGSFRGVRLARMRSVVRSNMAFLRYSTPQTLIDNALAHGINFVLAAFAGAAVVGYFNFMQRVIKAPLALLFSAVSQVLFRFAAKNRDDPALVAGALARTQRYVAGGLVAALLAVLMVREFFEFLPFAGRWAGLRDYVLPISVWMLGPFLFSPFATLPVVYDRQRQFFLVATGYNLLALAALTLMFSAGVVSAAFWIVGLASVLYYLGMNRWLLGFVDDHAQG
jgi:O-antigen/teichoic acid export membrane protein